MVTERKSRRRRRKKILRRNDGSLYDATERRRITLVELRDFVRDGGLFEARRQENGTDCTHEVLQSVMGVGMLENLIPGLGGGSLPGLGGLGGLAGGGPLGALGGGAGLADLVRLVDDRARDDDEWEEPRRRSRSKPSRDWDRDDRGWADGERDEEPRRRARWSEDPDWSERNFD